MMACDEDQERPYLFLNEQTLLYNVGIRSCRAGKESIHTIVRAGCNWYDIQESCEMLLRGDSILEFVFQSMLGGEPIQAGLMLTDIPVKKDGVRRVQVDIHFESPFQCEVKATDLGFGEIAPSSDLYWKETFWLDERKEDDHGAGYDL